MSRAPKRFLLVGAVAVVGFIGVARVAMADGPDYPYNTHEGACVNICRANCNCGVFPVPQ